MISPLQELSISDLQALAEAIESGRLGAPFTVAAVQKYCPRTNCEAVAEELLQLMGTSRTAASLPRFLKILVDDRTSRPGVDDAIDLVSTGPEAPETANRDTGVVVRELFAGAEESVLVVGYAVYQGREIFRALAERMEEVPNLRVTMCLHVHRAHGDTTESSELLQQFARRFKNREWPGKKMPDVYYDPRTLEIDADKKASLHAKCIVVDKAQAFVSSANFTEAAQIRNIEVGTLIRSPRFSKRLANHFYSLVAKDYLLRIPGI